PARGREPSAITVTRTLLESEPRLHDQVRRHIDAADDGKVTSRSFVADAASLFLRHAYENRRNAFDVRIALDLLIDIAGQVEQSGPSFEHHRRCLVGTALGHDHDLESQHVDALVDGAAIAEHEAPQRHGDGYSQRDTGYCQRRTYRAPAQVLGCQSDI